MKNSEEFIAKMNEEVKTTSPGSTQEDFVKGMIERAQKEKDKPKDVEYSENPEDMEEIFEGVEPEKEIIKEKEVFDIKKATQRLGEIKDILKDQEGLMASDPEDRAKMIGSFKKEEMKKEMALISENLKKEGKSEKKETKKKKEIVKDSVKAAAEIRKIANEKLEKNIITREEATFLKNKADQIEGVIRQTEPPAPLRKRGKESLEKKINKNEEEVEKIKKEIKEVINKELGGEVEAPKTPEGKLILAEKRLEEMRSIVKELTQNIKNNLDEFNRLFKSENIMSNFINKLWWESDRHDELDNDIIFLESELKRAEETKKELETEIKGIKKEIGFQEGRKKSKVSGKKTKKDIFSLEGAEKKEELEKLQAESRKDELVDDLNKIDFEIEKTQKEKELMDKTKEDSGSEDVLKGMEKKDQEIESLAEKRKNIEKDYYSLFTLREIEDEMDKTNEQLDLLNKKSFSDEIIMKKKIILDEKMKILGEAYGKLIE